MNNNEQTTPETTAELVFTVTANFTAEPLAEFIRYWIVRLDLGPARVEVSGYNQLFQELIAPQSLLGSSAPGANFILIRLEDWARARKDARWVEAVTSATHEFVTCLKAFAKRSRRPTLVLLCQPSQDATAEPERINLLKPVLEQAAGDLDNRVAGRESDNR